MPLTSFLCPDGGDAPVLECLARCRLRKRCLSLPTLRHCASERLDAKFSITQLLNGTMQEYLRRTVDYTIPPKSMAFALHGTEHHHLLESFAIGDELSEVELEGVIKGHPDLIETDPDGVTTLWDYKTWGSYRVAKFLGMTAELIADLSGAVYEKSGSWGMKGSPKMVKMWTPNPLVADVLEPTLQLNGYRRLLHPLQVDIMRLQVTVRDGGLMVASQRGISENIYTFDIERMDDEEVDRYFESKASNLATALREGWTQPCSQAERWDDERCRNYCDVAFACEHGRGVK